MTPQKSIRRLAVVLYSAFLVSMLITGHLFVIQVIEHERYLSEAERQHKRKITLPPRRGNIFDCRGNPLALSAEGLDVYAVPERIADKEGAARILAEQLNLNTKSLQRRISSSRPFVMIQQKVNPISIRKLCEMDLPGIGFISSPKRYYPRNSLAAQVIGYVGVDECGLTGVEFKYDSQLRGEPGWLVIQRDAKGQPYNMLEYPLCKQVNGRSLKLTLDAEFQEIVEHALGLAVRTSGARNGCIVAVRPEDGRIVALANYPPVDLNGNRTFGKQDFLNLVTNLPFEPGSTAKVFTASALLAERCVTLEDSVFCENGVYTIGRRTIRDVHPYGKLSVEEVIAKSSNIGMSKLVRRIEDEKLYRIIRAFGFGETTGDCFNGEDLGVLPLPSQWDRTTKTSLAIGYNFMATPLQMAMAYAALANGGVLYEPCLIEEILDENEQVLYSFKPRPVRRVLPEQVAGAITRAMVAVVDHGTGTEADVPGYVVAGKTGTSMKADPRTGYDGSAYIGSFGGIFPADDPQLVIFVVINNPDYTHRWGGVCAASAFGEIIRNTLVSNSEVIDRTRLVNSSPPPQLVLKNPAPESFQPTSAAPRSQLSGRETAPDQQSSFVVMPGITGLTVREAVEKLTDLGLKVSISGGIRVRAQQPKAGTRLNRGALCLLTGYLSEHPENTLSLLGGAGGQKEKKSGPEKPNGENR